MYVSCRVTPSVNPSIHSPIPTANSWRGGRSDGTSDADSYLAAICMESHAHGCDCDCGCDGHGDGDGDGDDVHIGGVIVHSGELVKIDTSGTTPVQIDVDRPTDRLTGLPIDGPTDGPTARQIDKRTD